MIALQVDWARQGGVREHRPSGRAADRLVIDDFFTIENHGHVSVDQGEIIGLPLTAPAESFQPEAARV